LKRKVLSFAQYLETVRRKAELEPEKRLMLAVLEDAVDCFQNNIFAQDTRQMRLFQEAEEWILAENNESICEGLGYDADFVRQGLMAWKIRLLCHACP